MPPDEGRLPEARRSRVTIKDVARKAGVSMTTASVVLNERPTKIPVGEETRRRVLAVGAELGYRPNPFAQSLRTGRSRTLGLVVTTIADPFTSAVVEAMDAVARERGYRTVLMLSGMGLSTEGQPARVEHFGQPFVDGLLLTGFQLVGYAPFPNVAARHRGVITGIANDPELPSFSVDVDTQAGVRAALQYLHDLGHRKIGMIYDPRHQAMRERRAAFDEFLRRGDLPVAPGAVGATEATYYEGGRVAAGGLLATGGPPTAIFAANDQLAIGALHAAWRLGKRVPDELSIVGFDDIPVARYCAPALTTVRQPMTEMGRRAIGTLIDVIEGKVPPPHVADLVLQPELIIRDSSAPPHRG